HYQDQFRARNLTSIFHTPQNIIVRKISGYPGYEKITDTFVKNVFYRNPGIEAGEDNRLGKLTRGCIPYQGGVISCREIITPESLIAAFQTFQYHIRCQGSLFFSS